MKPTQRKSLLFALCYVSYVFIYAARLNLSIASPVMIGDGTLTSGEYGMIGGAFFVVYAIGRLCNGMIGDRVAPWLMIGLGLGMTGLANLLISTMPSYLLILLLWSANAYAQSMLWSSLLRALTALYGKQEADRKAPILVSSVSVGNIAGIVLSTVMVEKISTRAAFLLPGAITVLLGLATATTLRSLPETPNQTKALFPFKTLLKNKKIRGMLMPALFHGIIKDNIGAWMAIYFVSRFGIDLEQSALFVLLIPTVGMIGRFLYPLCYRLSGRRENLISKIAFIGCAVLAGILCLNPASPLLSAICLSLIYALISIINSSMLSMFPLHFAKENMVSSVSGITDFSTYLGAGIGSAVYGFFNDNGNFVPMFVSWVAISILSFILLSFQKDQKGNEI